MGSADEERNMPLLVAPRLRSSTVLGSVLCDRLTDILLTSGTNLWLLDTPR